MTILWTDRAMGKVGHRNAVHLKEKMAINMAAATQFFVEMLAIWAGSTKQVCQTDGVQTWNVSLGSEVSAWLQRSNHILIKSVIRL